VNCFEPASFSLCVGSFISVPALEAFSMYSLLDYPLAEELFSEDRSVRIAIRTSADWRILLSLVGCGAVENV
jgi:hypothetical protein